MSFYVIGDIHGCFDEFQAMLDLISDDLDALILIGDYIDRGPKSYEMLRWLENDRPEHCITLRGNHEEEFIQNIELISIIADDIPLSKKYSHLKEASQYFDLYHTLEHLIYYYHVTLDDLQRWAQMFRHMPLSFSRKVNGRTYYMVHAGLMDNTAREQSDVSRKDFALYARDEVYTLGGVKNKTMIAGHTPTIIEGTMSYNHGNVFHYYNPEKNCNFYNIDCGCVFRRKYPDAKLACIRLEDEKIFYIPEVAERYFRIKVSNKEYVYYDWIDGFCLRERRIASIFQERHFKDDTLKKYLLHLNYTLEEVDAAEQFLQLCLFRDYTMPIFRIQLAPYELPEDQIFEYNYLHYNSNSGFQLGGKRTASIFFYQYLTDKDLMEYLADKEYRLVKSENTNRDRYSTFKYRGILK